MNKKVVLAFRIIFGLILLVLGVTSFLNLPIPESPDAAKAFLTALDDTGYINPVLGIVFFIVGLSFVLGRYVALGVVLLAPITVNIILFHLFLDLKSIIPGLVVFLLNMFIAYTEWGKYKMLFMSK